MKSFIRASLGLRSTIIVLAACLSLFAESAFAQAAFQFAVPGFRPPRTRTSTESGSRWRTEKPESTRSRSRNVLDGTRDRRPVRPVSGRRMSKVTGDMSGGVALSGVNWHTGATPDSTWLSSTWSTTPTGP